MATLASLNLDLRAYLCDETKCAILNAIWGSNFTTQQFAQDPSLENSYFKYYDEQCKHVLHFKRLGNVLKKHAHIIDIIQKLRHSNATRQQEIDDLRSKLRLQSLSSSDALISQAIDLAVRIWLMVDIGKVPDSLVPCQTPLVWANGTLKEFIENQFSPPVAVQKQIRIKLDKIFTARNLECIAGLQIIWTDNLSDHLRLTADTVADDRCISIFHHASVLKHHKDNHVFPCGFVDETLRTLSLLFPQYDAQSSKWLIRQQRSLGLDHHIIEAGQLKANERQIERFRFWHERIVALKQVFDDVEPSTISQWWFDTRRRVQWYTFWTAVVVVMLTLVFGVVQCVEGGLQVYKAYNPS